jgi:hypothetical protein
MVFGNAYDRQKTFAGSAARRTSVPETAARRERGTFI